MENLSDEGAPGRLLAAPGAAAALRPSYSNSSDDRTRISISTADPYDGRSEKAIPASAFCRFPTAAPLHDDCSSGQDGIAARMSPVPFALQILRSSQPGHSRHSPAVPPARKGRLPAGSGGGWSGSPLPAFDAGPVHTAWGDGRDCCGGVQDSVGGQVGRGGGRLDRADGSASMGCESDGLVHIYLHT